MTQGNTVKKFEKDLCKFTGAKYCITTNSASTALFLSIKTILTNDSIKIFGNPNLKINKDIVIKNFLKDHRVFMTSVVAALTFGGNWTISDLGSIKTSFPTFMSKIKILGNYCD